MKVNYTEPFNFKPIPTITPASSYWENGTWKFNMSEISAGAASQPSWIDIILKGNTALSLVNSKADGLNYLKLFGDTEQLPEQYLDTVVLSGGCEQRNLPVGYTQLEYIQSNGTQYIDTGITDITNSEFEVVAQQTSITGAFPTIMGALDSDSNYKVICGLSTSNNTFYSQCGGPNGHIVSSVPNDTQKHTFKVTTTTNQQTLQIDDMAVVIGNYAITSTTGYPLTICARNKDTVSNFTNQKVFSVRIKKSGTLVCNLIPARRNSDNVLGMYDTVNGVFYQNAGTGTFTAGPEVVPTPDYPIDIVCNNGVVKLSPNLFNKSSMYIRGYIESSGNIEQNNGYTITMPCEPNTTYTFSRQQSSGRYRCGCTPATTVTVGSSGITLISSKSVAEDVVLDTVTTTADAKTLVIWFTNTSNEEELQSQLNQIQIQKGSVATPYHAYGQVYTDGTQEVVTDNIGNTASAERLLAVGDYKDTQEVLSGSVSRNIGIKVLDGTEDWQITPSSNAPLRIAIPEMMNSSKIGLNNIFGICSHFQAVANTASWVNYNNMVSVMENSRNVCFRYLSGISNVDTFKQFLTDQYNAGTPVILVYPLATATTESVSGQLLQKSPVTQTAGAISGLTITTTESAHTTPTPQQPLQINCNNGVVKVSPNLFDKNNTLANNRIWAPNFSQQDLNGYYGTNIIKVIGGHTYTRSGSHGGANYFKLSDNTYTQTSDSNATITVPDNAVEWVFNNTTNTDRDTMMVVEGSSLPAEYMPYGIYIDGTTETVEITGKNLFDPTKVLFGYYRDRTTGDKTQSTQNFMSSDDGYIPCLPNTTYTFVGTNKTNGTYSKYNTIYFFDSAKNYLGASPYEVSQFTTGTTPSNCRYLQVRSNPLDNSTPIQNAFAQFNWQLELGSTATTYEPYYNGGTATAEMLLAIGSYQDVQSVLDGEVTRNIGIKVFDGTENWATSGTTFITNITDSNPNLSYQKLLYCTHYPALNDVTETFGVNMTVYSSGNYASLYLKGSGFSTSSELNTWLAQQYNAGTPMIVVYPLSSPATETVTAQPLTIQAGSNIVEITQASIDNLELEVSYKAGVAVTITEVQNAQLDDNVEVTING